MARLMRSSSIACRRRQYHRFVPGKASCALRMGIALLRVLFLHEVYEEKRLFQLIKEISVYTCKVNVYRKGLNDEIFPRKIDSRELVPGDLYEIPEDGKSLPCDTILIKGSGCKTCLL